MKDNRCKDCKHSYKTHLKTWLKCDKLVDSETSVTRPNYSCFMYEDALE